MLKITFALWVTSVTHVGFTEPPPQRAVLHFQAFRLFSALKQGLVCHSSGSNGITVLMR